MVDELLNSLILIFFLSNGLIVFWNQLRVPKGVKIYAINKTVITGKHRRILLGGGNNRRTELLPENWTRV